MSIPASEVTHNALWWVEFALTSGDKSIDPEDILGTMEGAVLRADRVRVHSSGCPVPVRDDALAGRVCGESWNSR